MTVTVFVLCLQFDEHCISLDFVFISHRMSHLCAICVGLAATLVMAAPPTIAAVWFPPEERTTATGNDSLPYIRTSIQ